MQRKLKYASILKTATAKNDIRVSVVFLNGLRREKLTMLYAIKRVADQPSNQRLCDSLSFKYNSQTCTSNGDNCIKQ